MLHPLPTVLLSHACSFLSPKELLVTLAHTAKSTRAQLTPVCFSHHVLQLSTFELSVLSSFGPPSSLTLQPFHRRVLSDCCISVFLEASDSVQQVLDSLDYFPTCKALSVKANAALSLSDPELHSLLHLPAILSCDGLTLRGFHRSLPETVPAAGQQIEDRRVTRAKRKRSDEVTPYDRTKQFNWKNIHVRVTRLHLMLYGYALYKGGAAFLTAHAALQRLHISTYIVSGVELTAIFRDRAALPQLTHFGLYEDTPRRTKKPYSITLVLLALATTVVRASGKVRPMERLTLEIATSNEMVAAASLMPELTFLDITEARPGWLEGWIGTPQMVTAFPLLQKFMLHASKPRHREPPAAAPVPMVNRDILPLFRSMAGCPIQRLVISTDEHFTCSAAAISQLASCHQLRELELDFCNGSIGQGVWIDWTDSTLFSSFTAGCLSNLCVLKLQHVKLSAESMAAIASAAPQLRTFSANPLELSCHPAVVCVILGACCEHIKDVHVDDSCCHVWRDVQADVVVDAYQSAMAAARRKDGYAPFEQLQQLHVAMCWCTPPSVWHALLSLLKCATRLRFVKSLWSDEPLAICALKYLPSLTAFNANCHWPESFGVLMERRNQQTGRYRFVACRELTGYSVSRYSELWQPAFVLTSSVEKTVEWRERPYHRRRPAKEKHIGQPIVIRPYSQPFTAYQRSLASERQSALARWARGDFDAEGLVGEPCNSVQVQGTEAAAPVNHRVCTRQPHVESLRFWYRVTAEEDGDQEEVEEVVVDVKIECSDSDDDEKSSEVRTCREIRAAH